MEDDEKETESYYQRHQSHLKVKSKEYYYKNKDKISKRSKLYYENNRDKIRQRNIEYYHRNKENLKDKKKLYMDMYLKRRKEMGLPSKRTHDQDYFKRYYANNKEKYQIYYQNRKRKLGKIKDNDTTIANDMTNMLGSMVEDTQVLHF